MLQLLKLVHTEAHTPQDEPPQWKAHTTVKSSPHLLQQEKACVQQWRPSEAKNK